MKSLEALNEELQNILPKSIAQWNEGKSVMPGGVIKGAYFLPPCPVYMDRSRDCYLWDIDGHRYVDFANHHTAMILGHSHPAVVEAVKNALDRGFALGGPTKLEKEIAEELVNRFPAIDKVRYTNSATEASINATRIVRKVSGKPKVAKFEGSYHGFNPSLEYSTSPPLDQAGPVEAPEAIPGQDGMPRGIQNDVVILPMNDLESMELILREHKDDLAAVFHDGRPGWYEAPEEHTKFLRKLTAELGIYLVFDEVVSFRVGYSGYQGLVGVEPDLTIFGKIVGGGLPGGALGGKSELMDVLDNTEEQTGLNQSGTFAGNHFTLSAGLATLRALTPEVYSHLETLGQHLQKGLLGVFDRVGINGHVVRSGSTVTAYFTDRPVRSWRDTLTADTQAFERLVLGLLTKGYYARDRMGFIPSVPMDSTHVDGLIEATESVLVDKD